MAESIAPPFAALAANPAGAGRAPQAYWHRVVVIARARWRPFVVLAAAMSLVNSLHAMSIGFLEVSWLMDVGAHTLAWAPLCFAALVLSEALGLRGLRHALTSCGALLLAILAAAAMITWLRGGVLAPLLVGPHYIVSDGAFLARMIWFNLVSMMLLVLYLAIKDREAASVRFARAVELERATAQRVTLTARLKVLQAQVEPALLFGVLEDVLRNYARDALAADALLDDLIAYLRAALPQMRSEASTLGREVALAAAYLRLHPAARAGAMRVRVDAGGSPDLVPFPPMVLLPLVQAASQEQPSRVALAVASALDRVRLIVDVAPPLLAAWSDERLAPLRATLVQYFGARAALTIDGSRAVIEMPAPNGDPRARRA
ncbi:MAG: histidine kinase [Gemmatimonadota bacterium]